MPFIDFVSHVWSCENIVLAIVLSAWVENILKYLFGWIIPIISVCFSSGCVTKWKRDSSEKTFKNIYARIWGVQEWGYAYRKATTCKSCASFGILHWKWWTNANLRVHAKQKLGLLPLWFNIFPASNYNIWDMLNAIFHILVLY